MNPTRWSASAALALAAVALTACSGTASPTATTPSGTAVTVAVDPGAPVVQPNQAVAFAATVTGAVNTSVAWSVVEAGGGTVDATGRYVAPSGAGIFHVKAVSAADPAVSGAATVTVTQPPPPVAVSVTPSAPGVDACKVLTLTATVTGTSNGAVTWSILEGAAGGAVSSAGVYTAPTAGGTYHVVATSVADPTKSAVATVSVTERVLSVQVTPATVTLTAGGTTQLTATVTTTCGSFASVATVGPTGRVTAN
jgi:hypothetical protein